MAFLSPQDLNCQDQLLKLNCLPPSCPLSTHYLFPLLLVPSQAPTPPSESPIGRDQETKRQERSKVQKEAEWAETPRSWGTRNRSGMGDIRATWGLGREEEDPALLSPPPAPVPRVPSPPCWPFSSPHLGAFAGPGAGPRRPGQNPGPEPTGAWKQPQ